MTRPAELKYSPSHEWTRLEDGIATVGITDFAVEQLGDLVFIDLPAGSETLKKNRSSSTCSNTKTCLPRKMNTESNWDSVFETY